MGRGGRNVLCSCGSKKKYRECCGKNTVISLDRRIEAELNSIQLDILRYALANYQDDMEEYLEEYYDELDIPDEAMELFHFFSCIWFITSIPLGDKTILETYIDQHLYTYSKQRIKDILQSWKKVRPSISVVLQVKEPQFISVQDLLTGKIHEITNFEDGQHHVEKGGMILGTILPAGSSSIFFATFLDLSANESKGRGEVIVDLFENSEFEYPTDFMAATFMKVLDTFIFGKISISIESFNWTSPMHKEVAKRYQEYTEQKCRNEPDLFLGLFLWHQYCLHRNPSVKKANVYAAALIYFVERISLSEGFSTQKKLARDFHVSTSSISAKFKDIEAVLIDEINELNMAAEVLDE